MYGVSRVRILSKASHSGPGLINLTPSTFLAHLDYLVRSLYSHIASLYYNNILIIIIIFYNWKYCFNNIYICNITLFLCKTFKNKSNICIFVRCFAFLLLIRGLPLHKKCSKPIYYYVLSVIRRPLYNRYFAYLTNFHQPSSPQHPAHNLLQMPFKPLQNVDTRKRLYIHCLLCLAFVDMTLCE